MTDNDRTDRVEVGGDWFARNADYKNPQAAIRYDPAYFASECASAINEGRLAALSGAGGKINGAGEHHFETLMDAAGTLSRLGDPNAASEVRKAAQALAALATHPGDHPGDAGEEDRLIRAVYADNPFKVVSQALADATGLPMDAVIPYDRAIAIGMDDRGVQRIVRVVLATLSPTSAPAGDRELTLAAVEREAKRLMQEAAGKRGLPLSEWIAKRMSDAADRALSSAPAGDGARVAARLRALLASVDLPVTVRWDSKGYGRLYQAPEEPHFATGDLLAELFGDGEGLIAEALNALPVLLDYIDTLSALSAQATDREKVLEEALGEASSTLVVIREAADEELVTKVAAEAIDKIDRLLDAQAPLEAGR